MNYTHLLSPFLTFLISLTFDILRMPTGHFLWVVQLLSQIDIPGSELSIFKPLYSTKIVISLYSLSQLLWVKPCITFNPGLSYLYFPSLIRGVKRMELTFTEYLPLIRHLATCVIYVGPCNPHSTLLMRLRGSVTCPMSLAHCVYAEQLFQLCQLRPI